MVRSSSEVIRFRIIRHTSRTTIDGDWFSTNRELSRSAWRQIESRWNAETREYRCKGGSCGGGRACVILTIAPEREAAWRTFLSEILSRPESWLVADGHGNFVPQTSGLQEAA
jgi:hypothetical protein